ncbi:MAG: TetR/AcrR family transcriptional regulator [Ruminiclostridium sp.]
MVTVENKISTKQKIFETAIELFSKKGCNGVSMREIAKETGIKESSIYNHYKSKAEMIDNIFDFFASSIKNYRPSEAELNNMMNYMTPEDLFKQLLISYGRVLNGKLDSIARIIYSEQFRNEKAKKLMLENILMEPATYINKLLNMMLEKKMLKQVDTSLLADEYNYSLVALSFEYAHAVNNGEDAAPIIKKMFNHIEFICSYLKRDE